MVVIVFGLPGSGKSYFASRLAKKISAEYVNSDRLRKEIFQKRSYSDREKNIVYEAMLEKMKKALNEKRDIVLDATFYKTQIRKSFIQEDRENIFFIEIKASESLIRERLKKERADSEADFEVYKIIQLQWEPFNEKHLSLESTDKNIDRMLQKAIQYLTEK